MVCAFAKQAFEQMPAFRVRKKVDEREREFALVEVFAEALLGVVLQVDTVSKAYPRVFWFWVVRKGRVPRWSTD
jgi:hypothetical protein